MSSRRDAFDRLAGAAAVLVLLAWLAYGWEKSTGLTFATRGSRGQISTASHLAQTKRTAFGLTIVCVPLALVYFVLLRDS